MMRPIKLYVHPANTKISLGICTQWEAKDPCILNADCKDQTEQSFSITCIIAVIYIVVY